MNIFEFMGQHPIMTVIIVLIVAEVVVVVAKRTLRCFNIYTHGWPPPHCDADGDFPEREEDDRATY